MQQQIKQRHQWQRSRIIENWENCRHCRQKRHRVKGKLYYDDVSISRTYCGEPESEMPTERKAKQEEGI